MRETPRRCKAASPPSLFISQYFIRSEPSSSAFSPSLVSHLDYPMGRGFLNVIGAPRLVFPSLA